MGFTLLEAAVEVTADGSKAAQQAASDIEGSPLSTSAGMGFGKKLVAGIGAAVLGAGLASKIAEGMDIQVGNAKIAAQLDLTKAQAATAGKAAGQLYSSNYGDSMEDVQDAVAAVIGSIDGMKDANASTVNAMTTKLLNLRTAFGIDVGESAAAAGALVKSGLAQNTNEAVDLMTTGLQKVPPAMREALLDSVNEYAPYLKGMGFTAQEGFGLLVNAAKGGEIQLDKAGDAVKEFGIRATDGSKASAASFTAAGLGPKMHDLSNDLLAGGDRAHDAFQTIVKGLQGIKDPSARAQAAIGLFGTPLEDVSVQDIPKFLAGLTSGEQGMEKVAGSADRMGAKLNDTAKNSVQSIQRGFQGWTNDLIANSGAIGTVATVAATVGGPLLQFGGALAVAVPALQALGIGAKLAAAGQWLLNAAMTANPIGIIIVAIAALVAGLIWFFTQTKLGQTIWAGFVGWLTGIINGLAAWWSGVWNGIASFFVGIWNTLVAAVTAHVQMMATVIRAVIYATQVIWSAIWNTVSSVARGIWAGIVGFITGYVNTVRTVIEVGIRAAQITWSIVTNTIRTVASTIWNAIVGVIRGVLSTITSVVSSGINAAKNVWTTVTNAIQSTARSVWGAISGYISGIVSTIRGAITNAINSARSVWDSGVNTIRSATSSAFNAAVSAVRGAVNTIGNIVGGIRGIITGALSGAAGWLTSAGRSIVQGLINGITSMIGAVGAAISNVVNFIKAHLPHSPAKVGPMSGSGWSQGVVGAGGAIVGGIADGFNAEARRTRLAMPGVTTSGAYTGTMVASGSSLAAQAAGAPNVTAGMAGGDTWNVTLQVNMDEVSDVSRLLSVVNAIPQQARTGRQVIGK